MRAVGIVYLFLLSVLSVGATTICSADALPISEGASFCEILDPTSGHLLAQAQLLDREFFLSPAGTLVLQERGSAYALRSPLNPSAEADAAFQGEFSTPGDLSMTGHLLITGSVDRSISALANAGFQMTVDSQPTQTCNVGPTCTYNLTVPFVLGSPFDLNIAASASAASPFGTSSSSANFKINLMIAAFDKNGSRVPLTAVPEPASAVLAGLAVLGLLIYCATLRRAQENGHRAVNTYRRKKMNRNHLWMLLVTAPLLSASSLGYFEAACGPNEAPFGCVGTYENGPVSFSFPDLSRGRCPSSDTRLTPDPRQ